MRAVRGDFASEKKVAQRREAAKKKRVFFLRLRGRKGYWVKGLFDRPLICAAKILVEYLFRGTHDYRIGAAV